jgi:starch phosphorylase
VRGVRALRRFTVQAHLPEPLAGLAELVGNLRWSWDAATRELFADVDGDAWRACSGDPSRLLGTVSPERLEQLGRDKRFLRRLSEAVEDLHAYLGEPRWYQSLGDDVPAAVAYFSMEYGITEVLPQYSGGLGILAGDHLKTASDLGVPLAAVGLLYKSGYFVQSLNREGWQQERYPALDPLGLPISRLQWPDGSQVRVELTLPGERVLKAQVWLAQVGRVPLLLLDSDVEDNDPAARTVTDRLYGGSGEHRLQQELLLGVGGVRALRAWSQLTGTPQPEVWHCNEGHAGWLGVERLRELGEAGLSTDEGIAAIRASTVFTTHTPVPAGIDRFPRDLVAAHLPHACPGVDLQRVLALGEEADPTVFNMAHLGLRIGQWCNGVAALHGEVSRGMFAELWPGFDVAEVPIGHVTNGVHAPTWVHPKVMEIAARSEPALATSARGWEVIGELSDELIWDTRRRLREELVHEVRRRLRSSWLERGAMEAELGWVDTVFDPEALTIGFARRVPSYKRLTLMLRDPARLKKLLLDSDKPMQVVVAGKSHPADDGGKQLIQKMVEFTDDPEVRHRIVFLPDYDMAMARFLYSGCDVWLNNPLRPLEACGTSGMKSALNGGLNLSIRDGWWDEMADGENGWAIPSADVEDPERRDDLEAAALYDLLESSVVPRFHERVGGAPPRQWVSMVRHTLQTLGPKVLSSRMLRDYVQGYYTPAALAGRAAAAQGWTGARELAAWLSHVHRQWPGVRVAHVESGDAGGTPVLGQSLHVLAVVELNGLQPSDVEVQLVAGPVDDQDEIRAEGTVCLTHAGEDRWEGTLPLMRSGSFGYAVRVVPRHRLLPPGAAATGLVA